MTIPVSRVWRYLAVHLENSLTMKRVWYFLLLCPRNQDIFWKRHRNMGSHWFSFNSIKGIKICLGNNCWSARKIFEGKTTKLTECVQPLQKRLPPQMLYNPELYSGDLLLNMSLCFLFTQSIVTAHYVHLCNKRRICYSMPGTTPCA